MTTYLFVTDPDKYDVAGVEYGSGSWTCCKASRLGDRALVYLTGGVGIKFEWKILSDARPEKEFGYECEVEHAKTFRVPISIAELCSEFTRAEWGAPHVQFRGYRSLILPDEIAARVRALRLTRASRIESKNTTRNGDLQEAAFSEGERRAYVARIRSAALRAAAKKHWGLKCYCCGFEFEQFYGSLGRGAGIVHHLELFSAANGKRRTAKIEDVRVVCANCHYVIHMKKESVDVDKLQRLIADSWTSWADKGIKRKL